MDSKQFRRRVLAVVVILALVMCSLGATLYDLQVNQGEKYYSQSQYKITETQTVEAARGQILDRNGRVLVSDKAVYQVKLNTSLMGKAPQRNDAILSLLQVARATGTQWEDTLPISHEAPFTFTTDNPYYALTDNEDGTQSRTLTRLGKLCVKMKWIQDPTKDPEPVSDEETVQKEPGFFDKLKSIFSGGNSAPPRLRGARQSRRRRSPESFPERRTPPSFPQGYRRFRRGPDRSFPWCCATAGRQARRSACGAL